MIKRVRRSSFRAAPAVYKSSARETLERRRKHTKTVMTRAEAPHVQEIVSHAQTEARQLLKRDHSRSVSRKNIAGT